MDATNLDTHTHFHKSLLEHLIHMPMTTNTGYGLHRCVQALQIILTKEWVNKITLKSEFPKRPKNIRVTPHCLKLEIYNTCFSSTLILSLTCWLLFISLVLLFCSSSNFLFRSWSTDSAFLRTSDSFSAFLCDWKKRDSLSKCAACFLVLLLNHQSWLFSFTSFAE